MQYRGGGVDSTYHSSGQLDLTAVFDGQVHYVWCWTNAVERNARAIRLDLEYL